MGKGWSLARAVFFSLRFTARTAALISALLLGCYASADAVGILLKSAIGLPGWQLHAPLAEFAGNELRTEVKFNPAAVDFCKTLARRAPASQTAEINFSLRRLFRICTIGNRRKEMYGKWRHGGVW